MKHILWLAALTLFLSGLGSLSRAQTNKRDPMTDAEVDQMREAADYPNKRLELMVRFAKERIAMIELLQPDSESPRPASFRNRCCTEDRKMS